MITPSFALANKNEPGLLLPLIKGFRLLLIRYFKLAALWISVFLCLLILVGCSEDWQTLTNPENDDYFRKIEALTFWGNYKAISADGHQLVVVGDRGSIVRSDNGGTSWRAVTSNTKDDLTAIVRQGQELVAVGSKGAIVRSVDNGTIWQAVTSNTKDNLTAVVRQGQELVAVGNTIVRSVDSGASWQAVTNDTKAWFYAVVRQGQELVAVGDFGVIVRSVDGGASWQPVTSHTDANLNAVVRQDKELVAVGSGGTIVRSDNGGASWKTMTSGTSYWLKAVVRQGQELVAVGEGSVIVRSDDGGVSWEAVTSNSYDDLSAVARQGQELVAVGSGDHGTPIVRSVDGGASWKAVNTYYSSLSAVVRQGLELVAVGYNGAIVRSLDGGASWQPVTNGIHSPNLSAGVRQGLELVAVGGGAIVRSVDSGASWQLVTSDTKARARFNAVVRQGQELVAVGYEGAILRSVDGGASWQAVTSHTDATLTAVVRQGQELVAVGGTIVRSDDGGASWQAVTSNTKADLRAIVRQGQELVAVGSAIVRSVDGGASWQAVTSDTKASLSAVVRQDKELVAVGYRGTIVRSDDGGASWQAVTSNTKASLTAVVRQGQELVAMGDGSTLVSINAGLSWHELQTGNLNFAVFTEDKIHNSHAIAFGENTVALIATQQTLPILRKAALNFNPGKVDNLSLQIVPRKASCGDKGLMISVLAESHHRFIEEQQLLKTVGEKSIAQFNDEAVVTYDIPVTLAASLGADGIGAKPGDRFWYAVKLTCDGWTVQYPFEGKGATSQVYIPWYTRLQWWHWLVVTLTGFALLAVTVFLIRPIWIADFHRVSTRLGPLAETKLPLLDMKLGELLQIFNLWVVLLLVRQPRVLDAWVNKHAEAWKAHFENLTTVKRCRDYLALPCILDWDGDEQITPSMELPDRLFDKQSRVVEVVGVGGAGKTMLTIQLCRWAMEANQQRGSVRRLPLLIEEDCNHDSNQLLDIVQRRLKSLDIEEDDIFLRHLLKKGRLMLVFDRLSERAESTVEYIRKINGILPLGALLISTRYSFEYEGCLLKRISPVPLDPERMMGLMTTLLSQRSNKSSFSTFKEQTELAQKLAEMIQHDGHEFKLTPLLVTLFVQRAVKLVDEGKPLSDLPASIPEAYFNYLRDINPKDAGENRLSDDEMLRAAKALARLSLGDNFVPQDFPLEEGKATLKTAGWPDFDKVDPIKRLAINGVIVIRASAARDMIAFTLDPVAEYLAAAALIEASEHEPEGRAKMFEKVRGAGQSAKGFLFSLQQTAKLYNKPE